MAAKAIVWLIVASSVSLGAWIYTTRYKECRAHGFTTFYCALGR